MLFSLRPVFTARLRQCECFCRSNLELGEGGGRFEKNVRTSGKILATSLISPSAICVSAVNICIWSFLAWFSMMRIIYKHDDLGYSQESNCPFVVKYTWPCWYLFVTAKNLFRLTGWSFRTTKFFDPPSPRPLSSLAMRYSVTGMYIFQGSAVHICFVSKNHSHVKPVYNLVCSRVSFVITLGETKQGEVTDSAWMPSLMHLVI